MSGFIREILEQRRAEQLEKQREQEERELEIQWKEERKREWARNRFLIYAPNPPAENKDEHLRLWKKGKGLYRPAWLTKRGYPVISSTYDVKLARRIKAARAFAEFIEHEPPIETEEAPTEEKYFLIVLCVDDKTAWALLSGGEKGWSKEQFVSARKKLWSELYPYLRYLKHRDLPSWRKFLRKLEKGYPELAKYYARRRNPYFAFFFHDDLGKLYIAIYFAATLNPFIDGNWARAPYDDYLPPTFEEFAKMHKPYAKGKGKKWGKHHSLKTISVTEMSKERFLWELRHKVARRRCDAIPANLKSFTHSDIGELYEAMKAGQWMILFCHEKIFSSGAPPFSLKVKVKKIGYSKKNPKRWEKRAEKLAYTNEKPLGIFPFNKRKIIYEFYITEKKHIPKRKFRRKVTEHRLYQFWAKRRLKYDDLPEVKSIPYYRYSFTHRREFEEIQEFMFKNLAYLPTAQDPESVIKELMRKGIFFVGVHRFFNLDDSEYVDYTFYRNSEGKVIKEIKAKRPAAIVTVKSVYEHVPREKITTVNPWSVILTKEAEQKVRRLMDEKAQRKKEEWLRKKREEREKKKWDRILGLGGGWMMPRAP